MSKNRALPCSGIYMSVNFCGKDAFVPEHLLYYPEVGSVLKQVGGERMSESMRRYLFPYAGGQRLLFDHIEHRHAAQRFAETVEEHEILISVTRFGTYFEICIQSIGGYLSQWNQTLLVTFSDDTYEPFLTENVGQPELTGLTDAQTASV